MGDEKAASSKTEIDVLSQPAVDQLRKLLQEKGLPTTGRKKVLIERFLDDSKSNVVKLESKEEKNLTESSREVEIQEINSIRRKAKALQIDMDGLIREISELSQSTSNKVKVKLRIERLTVHREKYLQLRNEIVALIAEDMIEEELRRWGDLLRVVDKAIDVAHEYLQKDCRVEDQSSKENTHTDSRQLQILNCTGLNCQSLMGMC